MPLRPEQPDYTPLKNPAKAKSKFQESEVAPAFKPKRKQTIPASQPAAVIDVPATQTRVEPQPPSNRARLIRRAHALSYVGLFAFTAVLYFRPYELFPALASLDKLAFVLAIVTLVIFFPSQIASEGNLTYRPREINLVLLLCIAGLISIITAISPAEAWKEFNDVFIKAVLMFIVIVNVLRSKTRLRWLIYLAFSVTILLSINAIRDYRARAASAPSCRR